MRGRKTKRMVVAKRVIGYVRVSTEEQPQSGLSLGAQRARIEAFAVATDRKLDEIIIEPEKAPKRSRGPESSVF